MILHRVLYIFAFVLGGAAVTRLQRGKAFNGS